MKAIIYATLCIFLSCSSRQDQVDVDKHLDSLENENFEQLKQDVDQLKKDVNDLKEKDSLNSRM